jgi:hypothetical protein
LPGCSAQNLKQVVGKLDEVSKTAKQARKEAALQVKALTSELYEVNHNLRSIFTQLRYALT